MITRFVPAGIVAVTVPAGTVAPSIWSATVLVAYPLPTTVTVVPTLAEDGLIVVTDVDSTVNAAVLNAPPTNASVRTPAATVGTVYVATVGVGHAVAATNPAAVADDPPKVTPVGVVPEPKYVNCTPVCPTAPDKVLTAKISPAVTTLMVVVTVVVPSLMDIQYWPTAVGAVPASVTIPVIWPFSSVTSCKLALIWVFGSVHVAVGVRHAAGMPGENPKVTAVFALKPVASRRITTFAVVAGTYVVVESVAAVPNVIVTFGVTVNVAVPTFPLSSVTVTACAPATPDRDVVVPAGIWNRNTAVPCSVTVTLAGDIVAVLVSPTTLPTWMLLPALVIVAVGPKPVTVAVTHVPTGPELGDNVTVGVVSERVVVATLLHWSVIVKTGPAAVTAGRLTVAVTLPAVILLLLRLVGLLVEVYVVAGATGASMVIGLPEKDAAVTFWLKVVTIVLLGLGKPFAETVTEEPAERADGVTVTVGAVIVNVPATAFDSASEMITVCEPRFRP